MAFRARFIRIALIAAAFPAVLSTCDANLIGPAGLDDVALTFSGDSMLALGRTVPAPIEVRHAGTVVASPRLALTSSDSSVVDIAPNGDLVLRRLGSAT